MKIAQLANNSHDDAVATSRASKPSASASTALASAQAKATNNKQQQRHLPQ